VNSWMRDPASRLVIAAVRADLIHLIEFMQEVANVLGCKANLICLAAPFR